MLPAVVTSALRPRTALSEHLAWRRAIIYNKISSESFSVTSRQQGRRARHVLGSSPRKPGRDGQHIHRVTREALLCSRRSGLRLCVPTACMHGLASLTYQHCTPQALGRPIERPWPAPCSRPCACLLAPASAEPRRHLATRPAADGRRDAPGALERAGSARAGSAGASGARAGFQPYQAVLCLDSNGAPVDHFCPQACGVQDAAAERTGARRLSAGNAVQARSDDDALDHLVQVCRLLRRMPGERSSAYAVPQQVRFLIMALGRPTAEIDTAGLTAASQERPALSAGQPGDRFGNPSLNILHRAVRCSMHSARPGSALTRLSAPPSHTLFDTVTLLLLCWRSWCRSCRLPCACAPHSAWGRCAQPSLYSGPPLLSQYPVPCR